MSFESILDLKEAVKGMTRPEFFLDLNIDQIIERVAGKNVKIAEYFEYFPADLECERYRHDIYNDIRANGLDTELGRFVAGYESFRDLERKKNDTHIDAQKPVWNFYSMELYTRCLTELKEALECADLKSDGLKSLLEYLKGYVSDAGFIRMAERSVKLKEKIEALNVMAAYQNGRVVISVTDDTGEESTEDKDEDDIEEETDYEEFLRFFNDSNEKEFINPFAMTHELTKFEQEVIRIVAKRNPDIFKEAEKLYDQINSFEHKVFGRLADELGFYLSFNEFEKKVEAEGFAFCSPGTGSEELFRAEGLYDLALACVNIEKGRKVVSNDFSYDKGEYFFVLTGPNQGGKTTFARSLGQLVYFSKIGLDVPAKSADVRYFSDILTHFSVEESVETGRGKLMEELVRLAPMMKNNRGNAFIVINELFTTAANYDAIVMGKNVLAHFLGAGCFGIYVTHLRELCDVDPKIVGLSAQLDEHGKQNFKIQKKGVDYEGSARNQVEKYGLSFEKLKERLKTLADSDQDIKGK